MPDAELLHAAGGGGLRTQAGFEKQVRRMLADPRSRALADRFAAQWLRLQDLDKIIPDYLKYPQSDETLAAARWRSLLLFDSIVREDRSVLDLLTADYTFVNERLARHYGIPNVSGNGFQRVQVPDYRRGLLGQGGILTLTSVANRTSPVQRGKWVMEVLLGSPPPAPPPNVPALDDSVKAMPAARCCPRASAWRSTARTRHATRATASSTRSAWRSTTSTPPAPGASRTTRCRSTRWASSTTAPR